MPQSKEIVYFVRMIAYKSRRAILFITILLVSLQLYAQSGAVAFCGVNQLRAEHHTKTDSNLLFSGYHFGVTTRLGPDDWFLRVGLVVHRNQIIGSNTFAPFAKGSAYTFLKLPVQLGWRALKTKLLTIRFQGGGNINYTFGVQDNKLNIDHDHINDLFIGVALGLGLDIKWISFDLEYEKGITNYYTKRKNRADFLSLSAGFFF